MRKTVGLLLASGVLTVTGCVSWEEILDARQPDAIQNSLDKGRYLLSCPQATQELISRRIAMPQQEGGWMSGVQRAEYTVEVNGCDQQVTFLVVCPLPGSDCLAILPGIFNTWQRNE